MFAVSSNDIITMFYIFQILFENLTNFSPMDLFLLGWLKCVYYLNIDFLSGFSLKNILYSRDSRGRGRLSL